MTYKSEHDKLWDVCIKKATDFEPYGQAERNLPDCSCGCKHFVPLSGTVGADWGVCILSNGPRSGLLTFEHQGCMFFDEESSKGFSDEAESFNDDNGKADENEFEEIYYYDETDDTE